MHGDRASPPSLSWNLWGHPHRPGHRADLFVIKGNAEPDRQTPMSGRGRIDHFGLHAALPEAFATIGQWLIDHGASDGTLNDFGPVHRIFFRDPDGLEGEGY